MVKRHLSRLNAPKTWPIKKKGIKFIMKTSAGPHSLETSVPANIVLKEMLGHAKSRKEAQQILNGKNFLVNGMVRKRINFPVGIMDVIELPGLKEQHRMLLTNKGKLILVPTKGAGSLLLKIKNKKMLKGKKLQLNFTNGSNILADKDTFKAGDTVVLDNKTRKVKEIIKMEKGATVFLIKGSKVGQVGKIEEFKKPSKLTPTNIIIKTKEGKVETRKAYAFVIGKDKPLITLEK